MARRGWPAVRWRRKTGASATSFHLNPAAGVRTLGAMYSAAYLPILVQVALAAVITAGVIAVSHLVGQRARKNTIKDTAYECGIASGGTGTGTRFSVKFYVTAMLFILFDIEVVFLIPWAFVYRDFLAHHISILAPMLFFLGVLVLGLYYEVRKGALEWEK
jgi:NADH-quinone oxidoreductase subunit A